MRRFGRSTARLLFKNHATTFAVGIGVVGVIMLAASFAAASPTTNIVVDGSKLNAATYGIGAISGGGGNSRFLADYPAAQEAEIMSYLFKPDYGANLQLLKLEIGGDGNSSTGSEPSVEPVQGQINCNAGYEWQIAEQAEALNPAIKLYGLQWGAPGWVGTSIWTTKDVSYVMDWLNCAKSHGLTISYLGGWNESGYNATWYENMRTALNNGGFKSVQIVADDEGAGSQWKVATGMAGNTTFGKAVSIVGTHDTCDSPTDGYACISTTTARGLSQPLWESEIGKLFSQVVGPSGGGATWVRSINNSYNQASATGLLQWPLVDADSPNLKYPGRGLLTADNPWSGQYAVNQLTWATAQTTQFVPQGWHHVNGANQPLGTTGTYNTYAAPDKSGWTIVAENTGHSATQTAINQNINVTIQGGLPTNVPIYVWETNLNSSDPSTWFVQQPNVTLSSSNTFTYTIPAGYVVTFSTQPGGKGTGVSTNANTVEPLPYTATEDSSDEPTYFQPIEGNFEYAPCKTGETGSCIQQMAAQVPVFWAGTSTGSIPFGVVGDPTGWTNYTVSAAVNIPSTAANAGVIGRFGNPSDAHKADYDGYDFTLSGSGKWSLNKDVSATGPAALKTGTLTGTVVNKWHTLALSLQGSTITASIDGTIVATVTDTHATAGQAGLESTWSTVQYDNFQVTAN